MKTGGIVSWQDCEQEAYPPSPWAPGPAEEMQIQVQGFKASILTGVCFSHHNALLEAGVGWKLW